MTFFFQPFKPTNQMQHDIIAQTPITLDNGNIVDAYIYKEPSGVFSLKINYIFEANTNSTRTKQITEALWRKQHREWFRFIRFQRSSTPLSMPKPNNQ
jgi:hypothetical protein